MTKHAERQLIPVVETVAVPKHAWLVLFDSARRCHVSIDVHPTEVTYHAEEMLRIWAASEGLKVVEQENRPEYGNPYINLKVCFDASGYAGLYGVTIYRIRELVRVEPEPGELADDGACDNYECDRCGDDVRDAGHDDERCHSAGNDPGMEDVERGVPMVVQS